jgi:cysteine desulfurase / selenocysteine lyase
MDNSATSYPKPPQVLKAMARFMTRIGANPGRSEHDMSREASMVVEDAREKLAALFNIPDPKRIVFTLNATESLNTVIYGVLDGGNHVIITHTEHNSVWRPLVDLEQRGIIELSVASCDKMGVLDIQSLKSLIKKTTSLIVVNHGSNVCGTIQDLLTIRRETGSIPLLVDAAQTAGSAPIDVQEMGIDYLAFTGHKALFGPQGTGGLFVREGLTVRPLKRGGTGSFSESSEQPSFLPDALESGTRNNVGIAGLGAGVDFILRTGIEAIRRHETKLMEKFIDGLIDVPGIVMYGPLKTAMQLPVFSITFDKALPDGLELSFGGCGGRSVPATFETVHPEEAGVVLNENFDVLVRVGLHCAPLAHQALGTFPDGTVRFSMSYFNTEKDVEAAVKAVTHIAKKIDY